MTDARPVPDFEYVTFVDAPAEAVWAALTDPEQSARYWAHRNESTWRVGDEWRHVNAISGDVDCLGVVRAAEPPQLLEITFEDPAAYPGDDPSVVRFAIEEGTTATRVTLTHRGLATAGDRAAIALGWSSVLANLKTMLERGAPLHPRLWEFEPRG